MSNKLSVDKKGKLCCGFLADTRRGVLLGSAVGILLVAASYYYNLEYAYENMRDPELNYSSDVLNEIDLIQYIHTGVALLTCLGYLFGLLGTITFSPSYVQLNSLISLVSNLGLTGVFVWLGVQYDPDFPYYTVIGPMLALMFTLYANEGFIHEAKTGIMTPGSYASRERYCCCHICC